MWGSLLSTGKQRRRQEAIKRGAKNRRFARKRAAVLVERIYAMDRKTGEICVRCYYFDHPPIPHFRQQTIFKLEQNSNKTQKILSSSDIRKFHIPALGCCCCCCLSFVVIIPILPTFGRSKRELTGGIK